MKSELFSLEALQSPAGVLEPILETGQAGTTRLLYKTTSVSGNETVKLASIVVENTQKISTGAKLSYKHKAPY